MKFYRQLLGECELHGKKSGAAAHLYREKFGKFPPRKWNDLPAMPPEDEVRRWIQSRRIAYAKRRSA